MYTCNTCTKSMSIEPYSKLSFRATSPALRYLNRLNEESFSEDLLERHDEVTGAVLQCPSDPEPEAELEHC